MAMTTCKECGSPVSTQAAACSTCGARRPKRTSAFTWIVAIFLGVGLVGAMVGGTSNNSAPIKAPPDPKQEARFQMAAMGARALKQSMKNPDSFELTQAMAIGEDTFCYRYRARNSFNAVVPGTWVIVVSKKVSSGADSAWNKHCGGRSGEDITYVRQAL